MNVPSVSNAAAAQEAMETAAQTRAEAAHGDMQAARKVARMHVAQPPAAALAAQAATAAPVVTPAAPSVPPDAMGTLLNVKA